MLPTNLRFAKILFRLADLMEIGGGNPFQVNAYRRAGNSIERMERPVTEVHPKEIPGVGEGIALIIREWAETGSSSLLKEWEAKIPPDLLLLLRIPGLGPKRVGRLYQELGIDRLDQLEQAARAQRIRKLSGFGAKMELHLLKSIKQMKEIPEEIPIATLLSVAHEFKEWLAGIDTIEKAEVAGDLRRMKETGKELIFVLAAKDPKALTELLKQTPRLTKVIEEGEGGLERIPAQESKVDIEGESALEGNPARAKGKRLGEVEGRKKNGGAEEKTGSAGEVTLTVELEYLWPIRVRLFIVPPESFACALLYHTGSRDHLDRLVKRAAKMGLPLLSTGIAEGKKVECDATEEQLYQRLGLSYIPPEIREGKEEIRRAERGTIPRLIRPEDIRGDLHMHTDWSDGGNSIEEMARAAYRRGYRYIAITDHSRSLKIAGGLSIERLLNQRREIGEVEKRLREEWQDDSFRILAGVEMDILSDGRLDYPDEVLRELDLVIASVHTAFKQEEKVMMKRILAAVENNHVDIIAHPTGRLIGRRDPYAVNVEVLIKATKETGTVLELNANPNRLDLAPEYLELAMKAGVYLAINTDAHGIDELGNMGVGVGTARRGWVEPDRVINTWQCDRLLEYLRGRKV